MNARRELSCLAFDLLALGFCLWAALDNWRNVRRHVAALTLATDAAWSRQVQNLGQSSES